MAVKVTNEVLSEAYRRFKLQGVQIKNFANNRAAMLSSSVTEAELRAMLDNLTVQRTALVGYATTPGLAAYAKIQEDDNTYEAATEYTAMKAHLDSAITTLTNDIPAERTFTPAQTAGLKTTLEALDTAFE